MNSVDDLNNIKKRVLELNTAVAQIQGQRSEQATNLASILAKYGCKTVEEFSTKVKAMEAKRDSVLEEANKYIELTAPRVEKIREELLGNAVK